MKTFASFLLMTALVTPGAWAQAPAGPEQALLTVETAWSQAAVGRDRAALDRFYADEYIFTNEDGVASNKAKEIADITSGAFRLTSFKFSDFNVHVYGEVAVVTGQNNITGRWEDIAKDVSGPYRFTDVFVMRNGRWQCVASQSSRITTASSSDEPNATAKINKRLDDLAAVVNELAADRKSMREMMARHAGMMGAMMTNDSTTPTGDGPATHHPANAK
jgi:ketosteroid isomerase-like protein